MRMRKLGRGQSVVFCVPEEIRNMILTGTVKAGNSAIDVSDILSWAISETCTNLRRSMPLWAAQGRRFYHQNRLWADNPADGACMSQSQAKKFLELESQTLEDRYRPRSCNGMGFIDQVTPDMDLALIMDRCHEFDGLEFNSATLQEEQERELSPEIEQERQVQKSAPAQPEDHHIHADVKMFMYTGKLINGSKGYKPAFEALHDTSAAVHFDVSKFPCELMVTLDFARTVKAVGASYISDSYQRAVQWIVTSSDSSTSSIDNVVSRLVRHMMIISPYEAQELLPSIMSSPTTTLHLYSPRPNLGYRPLDSLDLHTVPARPEKLILPRSLVVQLNLFAGQLYLSTFQEYVDVCDFLGLMWKTAGEGCIVAPDGFIIRESVDMATSRPKFAFSPVKFMKLLMTKIRRNCEGIEKTHMGAILDARLLRESDFEAAERET